MHPDCSTCGESKPLVGRGMCRTCYTRAWHAGEIPKRTKKVKEPKRPPRISLVCRRCGVPFTVPPSRAVAGRGAYCSLACKDSQVSEWRNCEHCGERFHATRSQVLDGNGRYCSQRCWGLTKQNRLTRICQHCGGSFVVVPAQAAKGRGKYCSRTCYRAAQPPSCNSSWRPGMDSWRKGVLARAGYRCQRCNATDDLQAHHIKPWAKYPELRRDPANGIALCRSCHKHEHRSRIHLKP